MGSVYSKKRDRLGLMPMIWIWSERDRQTETETERDRYVRTSFYSFRYGDDSFRFLRKSRENV